MATERQRTANRANAAKSTGPKSRRGKRRAAQNARRHGLTVAPAEKDILRWYRVITNNPAADLREAWTSPSTRAALVLAEAEAQFERTREAERSHLEKVVDIALNRGRRSLGELAMAYDLEQFEDDDVLDLLIRNFSRSDMDKSERAFFVGGLRIFKRINPNRPAELNRRLRTLRRYRKRAEGQRNRAFSAWLKTCED